ncbi:MAG: argininosuccinate lyase [Rhodospirillaceae bacterium]|nr:argininosuccinate lyase [Rhodospirillaceae bacterium]
MSSSKVSSRLNESVAPEIIANIFAPRLAGFADTFGFLGDINKAHVIMLAEQGVLRAEHATVLARGILDMEAAGSAAVELDPAREDPYFNYEAHLMTQVGPDIGGRMHAGRSRNDIGSTLDRLRGRAVLLDQIEALVKLRETALEQAARYTDTIMPGYTHLQPAQPITYGFYLAGVAQALERDTQRLLDTLTQMNACPLGAAAFAGTPFPINRRRTADLLGFDSYVDNALDAVASRDFLLETMAHMSLLAVFWSRIAQDYHVWTTHEFGLIDFPDSVATTSSIMPQKKNPVVLEYLKGRAGSVVGALVAAAMGVKGTNFSHSGESSRWAVSSFWETSREVVRCIGLLELVFRTARPVAPRALERVTGDFSTATALADLLVRDHDLSFRAAHHVVGAVVRRALQEGLPADQVTADMVEDAAIMQLGKRVGVDPAEVRACLDPTLNVRARNSPGGPSPATVREHLSRASGRLGDTKACLAHWRARIAQAKADLEAATTRLADLKASV